MSSVRKTLLIEYKREEAEPIRVAGLMTIAEAAELGHVTRQAIFAAIRLGNLKAQKIGRRVYITAADYEEYRLNRYSRLNRTINGQKVYDLEAGKLNVQATAKVLAEILGKPVPVARIYYLLRNGHLKGYRSGVSWVVKKQDIIEYASRQRIFLEIAQAQ